MQSNPYRTWQCSRILGRYAHKIAISSHRLKHVDEARVIFSYNDYRHGAISKEMTLEAIEFIRLLQHAYFTKGVGKDKALWYLKQHQQNTSGYNYKRSIASTKTFGDNQPCFDP